MTVDLATLLPAIAALAGVIALVQLAERLARFSGFAGRRGGRGERLAVEEALSLDGRRRLAVVRCGAARVLLLTGGPQDVVVGWLPGGTPEGGMTERAIPEGAIPEGAPSKIAAARREEAPTPVPHDADAPS